MPYRDQRFYMFLAHASYPLIKAPRVVSRSVAAILSLHTYLSTQQSYQ